MGKIKNLKGKDLEFNIDNKEIMEFYKKAKFIILLDEKGETKTLVLE